MNKQTAVEWLVKELNSEINYIPMVHWDKIRGLVQKAKAMEKEQIVEAYWDGACNWDNEKTAEQFYNETYGGDK